MKNIQKPPSQLGLSFKTWLFMIVPGSVTIKEKNTKYQTPSLFRDSLISMKKSR